MIDDKSPPGSWQDHAAFQAARPKLDPLMQEYAQRLAKLERENDLVHERMAYWRERAGELEEALQTFGQHDGGCATWHFAEPCDCGFADAVDGK